MSYKLKKLIAQLVACAYGTGWHDGHTVAQGYPSEISDTDVVLAIMTALCGEEPHCDRSLLAMVADANRVLLELEPDRGLPLVEHFDPCV